MWSALLLFERNVKMLISDMPTNTLSQVLILDFPPYWVPTTCPWDSWNLELWSSEKSKFVILCLHTRKLFSHFGKMISQIFWFTLRTFKPWIYEVIWWPQKVKTKHREWLIHFMYNTTQIHYHMVDHWCRKFINLYSFNKKLLSMSFTTY